MLKRSHGIFIQDRTLVEFMKHVPCFTFRLIILIADSLILIINPILSFLLFGFGAVMKNPANLAKHQGNPKVAPVIAKMMSKFGGPK